MSVRRCDYCAVVYVQWLLCRDGRRRVFQSTPVDVADLAAGQIGWVPGRARIQGRERVALAPIAQVSSGKADAARRVLLVHDCPEFRRLHGQVFGSRMER